MATTYHFTQEGEVRGTNPKKHKKDKGLKSHKIFPLNKRQSFVNDRRAKIIMYERGKQHPIIEDEFVSYDDYLICYRALQAAEKQLKSLL